jgi:predicted nucleic acid-binding protein
MNKLKVFLDTSVLVRLLSGEKQLLAMFSQETLSQVSYVANPIVFQELLLFGERAAQKIDWDDLQHKIDVVPINLAEVDAEILRGLQNFRNLAVHSNDVLMIGSARGTGCDYFLTYDKALMKALGDKPVPMTPEEFLQSLGEGQ